MCDNRSNTVGTPPRRHGRRTLERHPFGNHPMETRTLKPAQSSAPALNTFVAILPFLGQGPDDLRALAESFKKQVNARDAIERMLVDQVLRAAERLRHAAETESQY